VGICNAKNATTIAGTALRLFAVTGNNTKKVVFPFKKLNCVEIDRIKRESKSLIVKQAPNLVEITDHPVYDVLNNVNDGDLNYFDGMDLTAQYLGMIGNCFWAIERGGNGLPVGIKVLPSEYTCVTLSDDMKVTGYRVFNGIYQKDYPPEDVIHFKNVSPGLFWQWNNALVTGLYGMGDAEYVLDEIYLYNSINDYLRALTENNAIPAGIVHYKGGKLDKNTMKDVQSQWDKVLRTWKRAGKVKVMDMDFEFEPIAMPPKDLEFSEGRKWLRGVIANAFGVPEDLITTENSNKASSSTAIHNYMRFSIKPRLRRIEERLNSHLITQWDDRLFFQFEECVPSDETLDLQKENQDLASGVITINEVRKGRGLQPVPWGDVPFQLKSPDAGKKPDAKPDVKPEDNEEPA